MTKREGVFAYLDCYRGHVSDETQVTLEESAYNGFPLTVTGYGDGWFIGVPQEPEYSSRIPVDLRRILDVARQNGCHYVRLDSYGQRHEDLPKPGRYAA
jgi:hypothetical protein